MASSDQIPEIQNEFEMCKEYLAHAFLSIKKFENKLEEVGISVVTPKLLDAIATTEFAWAKFEPITHVFNTTENLEPEHCPPQDKGLPGRTWTLQISNDTKTRPTQGYSVVIISGKNAFDLTFEGCGTVQSPDYPLLIDNLDARGLQDKPTDFTTTPTPHCQAAIRLQAPVETAIRNLGKLSVHPSDHLVHQSAQPVRKNAEPTPGYTCEVTPTTHEDNCSCIVSGF